MTFARVLLVAAWGIGIAGFLTHSPAEGVFLVIAAVLFTVLMVLLVAWAQPILVPSNVGRLSARSVLWSRKHPLLNVEINGDDTVFLQNLIDKTVRLGGQWVEFPAGIYSISSSLVIPNGIGLQGKPGGVAGIP